MCYISFSYLMLLIFSLLSSLNFPLLFCIHCLSRKWTAWCVCMYAFRNLHVCEHSIQKHIIKKLVAKNANLRRKAYKNDSRFPSTLFKRRKTWNNYGRRMEQALGCKNENLRDWAWQIWLFIPTGMSFA